MVHVNALNQNVGAVNELPLERKLEYLQFLDPEIKTISLRLEFQDDAKFSLVDDLIYKKINDSFKFVILESMIHNKLRIYHYNISLRRTENSRRD